MDWTYEIALRGPAAAAQALGDWFSSGARETLAALPGLASFDVYTPAEGSARDPYNQDGGGPLMLVMLGFASRDRLAAALGKLMLGPPPPTVAARGAAFERRFYPVAGEIKPLSAPFSYVVRYHRPAEDEAAFVANYLATHPQTQGDLPGIRSIMCYLPLDDLRAKANGLAVADYMIGNEVVFDDIDSFNAAMASPVREELRAHFRAFPRFSGAVTHDPMTRRRLTG